MLYLWNDATEHTHIRMKYIANNFHHIAAKIVKFYIFSSLLDLRQFMLYIANLKIQNGNLSQSWICKLPITSIPLRLESPNSICFRHYLMRDNLCYTFKIQKKWRPPSWVFKLPVAFILLQLDWSLNANSFLKIIF